MGLCWSHTDRGFSVSNPQVFFAELLVDPRYPKGTMSFFKKKTGMDPGEYRKRGDDE